jgi:hypothetical protein
MNLPSLRSEEQNAPASIAVWYDRGARVWVVQTLTADACQIGNVEHHFSKPAAAKFGRMRAEELGVPFAFGG